MHSPEEKPLSAMARARLYADVANAESRRRSKPHVTQAETKALLTTDSVVESTLHDLKRICDGHARRMAYASELPAGCLCDTTKANVGALYDLRDELKALYDLRDELKALCDATPM